MKSFETKSLPQVSDEATSLYSRYRLAAQKDADEQAAIARHWRIINAIPGEITDIESINVELREREEIFREQIDVNNQEIESLKHSVGHNFMRISQARARLGRQVSPLKAAEQHYLEHATAYYELAVISAHLEGVELCLEQPVIIGEL